MHVAKNKGHRKQPEEGRAGVFTVGVIVASTEQRRSSQGRRRGALGGEQQPRGPEMELICLVRHQLGGSRVKSVEDTGEIGASQKADFSWICLVPGKGQRTFISSSQLQGVGVY